jgi:hypothetical protein
MGKNNIKSQRIDTFAYFCKAQQEKLIRENNEISIDVPFYNQAIEDTVSELQLIAGNPIDWRTLIDYIKVKFLIIDRNVLGSDDDLVVAHVRDLLFWKFGDTFLGGDAGSITYDTATMGAKSLVLSQIANDILHKVRVDAGLENPPEPEQEQKPISTVSLDYDAWGDDCYYGENKQVRRVTGYGDFSNLVKESVDKLTVQHDEKAVEYCLSKLKKKTGSLKLDDIEKAANKENTTLVDYLVGIAEEYLENATIELNGNKLKQNGDEKIVFEQAKKLFAHELAKELIDLINKTTR